MSAPLRVAVIGAGGIASRHIGNLARFEDAALIGVADPVIERAQEQAARARDGAGSAEAFTDWRAMLDKVRPDALLICVPPFAHGEPELEAAHRKLPFFVEKPIAVDVATAERIGDAVIAAQIPTGVGYHWRYLDTVERARDLLADRPAQLAMGYWWDSTPPRDWWVREATSGGQMVEQTTHIFDLARHLVGEAVTVSGLERRVARPDAAFPDADVADATLANVRFASGAIGSFASTHLLRWPHRIALHLVSDAMVLELTEFELMVDVGRGRNTEKPTRDPFVAELRDFLTAARGGPNTIRAPFEEALRTHRLTTAATRAAHDGGVVDLPDEAATAGSNGHAAHANAAAAHPSAEDRAAAETIVP